MYSVNYIQNYEKCYSILNPSLKILYFVKLYTDKICSMHNFG